MEESGHEPASIWDAGITRGSIIQHTTTTTPNLEDFYISVFVLIAQDIPSAIVHHVESIQSCSGSGLGLERTSGQNYFCSYVLDKIDGQQEWNLHSPPLKLFCLSETIGEK